MPTNRLVVRLRRAFLRFALERVARAVRAEPTLGLEQIGTEYGGWIVPTALIRPEWICYCGGVGEDITFDLGLIERFGVDVFAFDPTPRAIAYVEHEAGTEPRFHFVPVGLWDENTTMRFFVPRNPAHVSHSLVNLQRTSEFFQAACRTVPSLKAELGHEEIHLVKLDIEGAEHRVIASMLDSGIRPIVLCTEIDQPVGAFRFWRTIRRVRGSGYTLVAISNWNFTFVRNDAIARIGGARDA